MLWVVTSLKLVCEVALMALLGRAVLRRLLATLARISLRVGQGGCR